VSIEDISDQNKEDWKENNTRIGSCKRCGKCCYVFEGDTKERTKCEHLDFDGEGLAVCKLYGTEDYPEECEEFPEFEDTDPYWEECGYYWESK